MTKYFFKNFYKIDQQKLKQHAAAIHSNLFGYHEIAMRTLGNYNLNPMDSRIYEIEHAALLDYEKKRDYEGLKEYVKREESSDIELKMPFKSGLLTVLLKERSILYYKDDELSSLYDELYEEYHNFILEHCKNGTFDGQFAAVYDSIVAELDKYNDIYS